LVPGPRHQNHTKNDRHDGFGQECLLTKDSPISQRKSVSAVLTADVDRSAEVIGIVEIFVGPVRPDQIESMLARLVSGDLMPDDVPATAG
jgi:hypothetical protein